MMYSYEIIFGGSLIRKGGEWDLCDTEEEAMEAGMDEIDYIVAYEEGYNEGDRGELSVYVVEVETEEEEEEE